MGEIERRRTIDRCRDWYKSLVVIHGPKEKETQGSQRLIVRSLNPSSSTKPASFEEPVSKTRCRYGFALRCFRVRADAQLPVRQTAGRENRRKAVIRAISSVAHRGVTNLTASILFTGERYGFSSRDAIFVVGSVLEKHFDGDFTPDHEKEITFKPSGHQS